MQPVAHPNHKNNFTAIVDTGASHHYCHGRALTTTFTSNAPPTTVDIANGKRIQSIGQAKLLLPDLPPGTQDCHIMSTFTNNLLSMGRFCNAGCTVIFTRTNIKVINKTGTVILQGFREQAGARMWQFNIYPPTPPVEAHAAAHTSPGHINHPHEPHIIPFDNDHHDQPAGQPLAIRHTVALPHSDASFSKFEISAKMPPTAPLTIYEPTTQTPSQAPTIARATTRATPMQSTEYHRRA
jgi:hypothetical protein